MSKNAWIVAGVILLLFLGGVIFWLKAKEQRTHQVEGPVYIRVDPIAVPAWEGKTERGQKFSEEARKALHESLGKTSQ